MYSLYSVTDFPTTETCWPTDRANLKSRSLIMCACVCVYHHHLFHFVLPIGPHLLFASVFPPAIPFLLLKQTNPHSHHQNNDPIVYVYLLTHYADKWDWGWQTFILGIKQNVWPQTLYLTRKKCKFSLEFQSKLYCMHMRCVYWWLAWDCFEMSANSQSVFGKSNKPEANLCTFITVKNGQKFNR